MERLVPLKSFDHVDWNNEDEPGVSSDRPMVTRPRSGRLICGCDLSAFALITTFSVFAVLAVAMIATGTIPHHYMGPDLPQVRHARVSAILLGVHTGMTL
jgi:hypothetical protein